MGVTGLWGILEPTGKPVRIQTLKGKVVSVDVSIWLHQSVKGFRDKDGNPIRNSHLLGVFHRVCKLLSHGIKPIFVFDGGVPTLKKQTMSLRRQRKIEAQDKSHISRNKLLQNLLKQQLQKQYLTDLPPTSAIEEEVDRILKSSENATKKAATQAASGANSKISPRKASKSPQKQPRSKTDEEFDDHFGKFREKLTENFNNFALFFSELDKQTRGDSESEEYDSDEDSSHPAKGHNYGHRDYDENFSSIVSPTFDELPLEVQHEMLFDMQESKKNNSWGKIDQMPKDLQNFSSFQMERLRKRSTLQKKIVSVQQEMGQRHIHLSNFDDLAAFNYEDMEKDTKIVGSKDKGLLYVAGPSSSSQSESVPGPSSSRPSQSLPTKSSTVITLDDFVAGGWSSSDEEDVVPSSSNTTAKSKTVQTETKTLGLTEEEEQLQRAIRLSLATQTQDEPSNSGSKEATFTSNLYADEEQGKPNSNTVAQTENETVALREEEQLQRAIRLSLATQKEASNSESKAATPVSTSTDREGRLSSVFEGTLSSAIAKETSKPVGIVSPFQSLKSTTAISKKSASIGTTTTTILPPGLNLNANEVPSPPAPSPSNKILVAEASKVIQKDNVINVSSGSSNSSESEFEEVMSDHAEEEKPKLDLQAIFDGVKGDTGPILTIAVNDQVSLKAEDDLFADIFEEEKKVKVQVEHKSNSEAVAPVNLKDSFLSKKLDLENEAELMREVKAADAIIDSFEGRDKDIRSNLKKTTVIEDSIKSAAMNQEELIDSSDTDFENVDIDIIVPEPTGTYLPGNLNNKGGELDVDLSVNKNQNITRTLGSDPSKSVRMISAQYMQAQEKLVSENEKLVSEKGFQERVATSITDQMYSEAQELLALFGVPFIISPMEAESQCAFLDIACLTEGTITDDSDVWLFGGQRVYKNFFSQGDRPLELFQYADIVSKLNLDREKLILIGILTGSDYTDGVEGVGPVKALEILSEFPSLTISALDSLVQFRDWLEKAQKNNQLDKGNPIRNKFRKIKLRSGFPSKAVYDAYMDPTVDDSTEPFRWGQPDLDGLRAYSKNKFGWDQSRCDANMLPLIRALRCQVEESTRQLSMDSFLTFGERHAAKNTKRKVKSKRLENAMKKLKFPDHSSDIKLSSESDSDSADKDDNHFQAPAHSSQKRRRKAKGQIKKDCEHGASANLDGVEGDGNSSGNEVDMEAELKDLLERMGVKRMTVKRNAGGNEDQNTSTSMSSPPNKFQKKGKKQFQKSHISKHSLILSTTGITEPEAYTDLSAPAPSSDLSSSSKPVVTPARAPASKKPQVIPQKSRQEHQKMMQKKKAIELFKSSKK